MTLEEKIKTKMDEYYVNKNIYGQTPIFEDGAKWMLSELKPVMEEMKEAAEILFDSETMKVIDSRAPYMHFKTGEINIDRVNKIQLALSKYNELFNK